MPARSPQITKILERTLRELGRQLREQRKSLGVSSVATAEAAGLSRVTLHRIERGEASVAMGAYLSVGAALGLTFSLVDPKKKNDQEFPKKIRIADYAQLKRLAWQLKDTEEISAKEALDLYERNWRHIDVKELDSHERALIKKLLAAFGRERLLV